MKIKAIMGLRPKAQDAASIRAAIGEAEAAQAEAKARAAGLEATRAATMLDGEAAQLERAERDLATARADAERAGIMLEALRGRLEAAERAEVLARVRTAAKDAEAASARFLAFMRDEYPKLAQKIAAGMRLETAASEATQAANAAFIALPPADVAQMMEEGVQMPPQPSMTIAPYLFPNFNANVRLPAARGSAWPPTDDCTFEFQGKVNA
ncbi:hypothetical protein [Falsiroseomonas sp. E2-1-a20]|uniref:hypothetical protein n=1 Tax=Falsiroseomonas sp. E2-1-a20 TaxID=3239300 RepID=UPI003F31EDFD